MQDLLLLILFSYPGIFADYVYSSLAKKKSFYSKPEDFYRVARDFFFSALCTLMCLTFFCPLAGVPFDISAVMNALKSGRMLWYYLGASLLTSVFVGLIWYGMKKALFDIQNQNKRNEEKPEIAIDKSIWSSINTDKDIPFMHCVLAIYKDGKLLRAGMAHNVTLNAAADPWIILKFTDLVEAELAQDAEKRTLLEQPAFSFTNIENGVTVDLYDGEKLGKYVDDWYASISEETSVE